MKNWQKVSLAILLILILIVLGVSFLAKSYLVPETLEALVIPKVEETIAHSISYTNIEVGFGGTIKLKDFSIPDLSSPQQVDLLQSQDMVLHCNIFPLLSKRIIIEEITLNQPRINLIRDKEGQYNFLKRTPEVGKKVADEKSTEKTSSDTSLSLIITHLNLKNGVLIFTDHLKTSSPPLQLMVKNINLHASHISRVSPFPLNLSAEIASNPLSFLKLKSVINLLQKEVESEVRLTPLNITYFAPYLPDIPFTPLEGYCSLDLKMTAHSTSGFCSQGLISLKDITLSPQSASDNKPSDIMGILRNTTVDLDHLVSYKPSEYTLLLEKLNATIQKATFSLEGKIAACKTSPSFDLSFKTGKLPVQNILDSIPEHFAPGSRDFSSSGTTEANLSIKGSLEKPENLKINGPITINKLTMQSRRRPHCRVQTEGKFLFRDNEIEIEHFKTTFKDSPLILKGKINNYIKGPLTAEIHLNSPTLTIDDIIYCLEKDKELTEQEEEEEQKEREIGPFNFNHMQVKADISLDNISYKNMLISGVKAKCRVKDNVLNLEIVEGMLSDGPFQLESHTNLGVKGLDYNLKLTGNTIQLNPIMTSLAPDWQENTDGIMDFTADLNGKGTTSDTFKKHLQGKGEIHIKEGKITGLKPVQAFSSFIKMDDLDTLTFDKSHGTFQIKDSLVHTKNSLEGKDLELYPQGTVSLDSYIDISLDMKLSPHLSERIANQALTKYFKDERGWTAIALAIKGPADEIAVMPASSTIKNISEMIVDILLKKEESDSDKRQDKKKALEDLLKELIRKSKEKKAK